MSPGGEVLIISTEAGDSGHTASPRWVRGDPAEGAAGLPAPPQRGQLKPSPPRPRGALSPSPGGNARLLPGPPAASPNPNQQRCFFSQDTFPGAEREGRCPCCFPWGLRRGVEGDSGGDTVALSQPGEASGSNGPGPGTPPEQARSPSPRPCSPWNRGPDTEEGARR